MPAAHCFLIWFAGSRFYLFYLVCVIFSLLPITCSNKGHTFFCKFMTFWFGHEWLKREPWEKICAESLKWLGAGALAKAVLQASWRNQLSAARTLLTCPKGREECWLVGVVQVPCCCWGFCATHHVRQTLTGGEKTISRLPQSKIEKEDRASYEIFFLDEEKGIELWLELTYLLFLGSSDLLWREVAKPRKLLVMSISVSVKYLR